jgi:hypothetical protein
MYNYNSFLINGLGLINYPKKNVVKLSEFSYFHRQLHHTVPGQAVLP